MLHAPNLHAHPLVHTFTHPLAPTPPTRTHTFSHTPTHSHAHPHTLTLTHTLTLPLPHSPHTHSQSLTKPLTCSYSHHPLALTHILTLTYTLTRPHMSTRTHLLTHLHTQGSFTPVCAVQEARQTHPLRPSSNSLALAVPGDGARPEATCRHHSAQLRSTQPSRGSENCSRP